MDIYIHNIIDSIHHPPTHADNKLNQVEMAKAAVVEGVEGAVILDGRVPHAVLLQLLSDK